MLEQFAAIIFFIGFIGMFVIIFRKIPILAELPTQARQKDSSVREEKLKILRTIKEKTGIKLFSSEILLQKMLSKIRILTLKTDNKTSAWLTKLRQKSIKKKNNFSDNYWQNLKKK
jgi:hypothetical protein